MRIVKPRGKRAKSVGGEVATDLRELVRLRNQAARSVGYRDHFAMVLAMQDFDEDRLFATLGEVEALTTQPFTALKGELDEQLATRFGCPVDALRPWHYDNPFFQDAPAAIGVDLDPYLADADLESLTVRTFEGMGLDARRRRAQRPHAAAPARSSTPSASTSTATAMSGS